MNIEKVLQKIKFPEERKYPIAFATFLMYLAWHPLGDFLESLTIGWKIIPDQLFTWEFWRWFIPFSQDFTQSYSLAFLAYFVPITMLAYIWFFLYKKFKINKYIVAVILIVAASFFIIPNLIPNTSVAYQNDIKGFKAHKMEPLGLWMDFHMIFWFLWMVFPNLLGLFTEEKTMLKMAGITWIVFLTAWISSHLLGSFIYVPIK